MVYAPGDLWAPGNCAGFNFLAVAFGKLFGRDQDVVEGFIFCLLGFSEAWTGSRVQEHLGSVKCVGCH